MSLVHPLSQGHTGHIVEVEAIDPRQRDQMFALMCRFYAHMQRFRFERDLRRQRWCLLLQDPDGRVLGFSTQTLLKVSVGGQEVRALYSGDTIVDRDYWGSQAMAVSFCRLAVSLIEQFEGDPFFWFLTTKGYRTYRFLPVFFREFYPRRDCPTPTWASTLIDALARCRYPVGYDAGRGVVKSSSTGYRLRKGVADMSPERLRDPHVQFFQERNPRHAQGDELCCIARLIPENFSAATRRLIRSKRYQAMDVGEGVFH